MRLDFANEKLRWRAPKGVVTPGDVAALRQRKAEVVSFLNEHTSRIVARWGDLSSVVEWFMVTPPPAEPFKLKPGITISDPARWWRDTIADIAAGRNGPRATCGALQDDLWRAYRMFGPRSVPIPGQ